MADKEEAFSIRKIIIDIICLCVVAFPLLLFKLFGEPYKRGFFCTDLSLRHPYHDSTVTSFSLYFIGLGVPIITILLTEFVRYKYGNKKVRKNEQLQYFGFDLTPLYESYKVIIIFLFGAASSQLTTDISKYIVGRLRPHFIDICQPDVDCNLPANQLKYITDFECTGTNAHRIHDSRLSFMSGHSSFSAFSMFFLIYYIQSRWTWKGSALLRHSVQYIAFCIAFSIALSRISDYKHHWSDVIIGAVQGIIFASLFVFHVSDLFKKKRENYEAVNCNVVLPLAANSNENKNETEITLN